MNGLMLMICSFTVVSLLLTLLGQVAGASKSHVSVKASFLSHCNYRQLETCEFIANYWGSAWEFLLDPEGYERGKQQQQLDVQAKELLSLSLRLRLHSPTIAIHASLKPERGPECNTYALFQGEFYCNPDNLNKALEEAERVVDCPKELPFGHTLGACGPIVYIYSRLGTKGDFPRFHHLLEPAARENKLIYIYRHLVEGGEMCPEEGTQTDQVDLGYGLELEVQRYPNKGLHWNGFELRPPSATGVPQNYTLLGHQAIEMILTAKDPLETLSLVAESAPLLMAHLEMITPSEIVQEQASTLTRKMPSGEPLIAINNFQVYPGHFGMQTLAEFSLAYKSLVNKFLRPVLESEEESITVAQEVMSLMHSSDPIRFDVRSPANVAIVLNDLAKDKQYESWPKTYLSLMRPPTTQFYPLAKNVVVMTVFMDLSQTQAVFVEEIARMLEQKIPIQVILILSDSGKSEEGVSASQRCAALYSIYQEYGRVAFFDLLKKIVIGAELQEAWGLTFEDLKIPSPILTSHLNKGQAAAREAKLFFAQFGISSTPTIFLNGRLLEFREQGWPRDVVKIYQDEIYRLQLLINDEELKDDTVDYYAQLLDDPKVARSRHPDVDPIHEGAYLMELPSWATSEEKKGEVSYSWLYSSKATDNCAYSVILKLTPAHVEHLENWLRIVETSERKMRLQIVFEKVPSPKDQQLWKVIKNLAERRLSTQEAIYQLKTICSTVRGNPEESSPTVIINGHVYGPFSSSPLGPADLESLLLLEWNMRTERLQLIRLAQGLERTPGALTAMTLFEGHLRALLKGRFVHLFTGDRAIELPVDKLNHFKLQESSSKALLSMTVIVDPLSMAGAKIASTLLHARSLIDAIVILNNRHFYDKQHFKFLYRFANPTYLDPLPLGTQYSLQPLTPPTWSVLAREAELNHLVHTSDCDYKVELLLDNLILEVDTILNGRGQAGLPLTLMTAGRHAKMIDQAVTITTKGYAQLAAPPGLYEVQPPSSIEGLGLSSSKAIVSSMGLNKLTISGVTGEFRRSVKLETLLQEAQAADEKLHIFLAPKTEKEATRLVNEVLERQSSSTSTPPLHIWVLSNALSLSARMLLRRRSPQSEYPLTIFTYQWPAWLVAPLGRSNRMRALRILFLDALPRRIRGRLVLVPSVAHDTMLLRWDELIESDLEEHVWAASPYCNSTTGYWKTAEWRRFLAANPFYAISQAVTLIDAARFREQAVGERLRTEYYRQSYDFRRLLPLPEEILVNRLTHDVPILSQKGCVAVDEEIPPIREHEEL